jgi:putative zinc- or iron-chelating protein
LARDAKTAKGTNLGMTILERTGPLQGQNAPNYGGRPDATGCNGCTDCCHLPEISVTGGEADRLQRLYHTVEQPLGALLIHDDPHHEGWRIMKGPCVFRQEDRPIAAGGCRIYDDRPGGCRTFTCRLLLDLRRNSPPPD